MWYAITFLAALWLCNTVSIIGLKRQVKEIENLKDLTPDMYEALMYIVEQRRCYKNEHPEEKFLKVSSSAE